MEADLLYLRSRRDQFGPMDLPIGGERRGHTRTR